MKHWREIESDLEATRRRSVSSLALHRAFVDLNGIQEWAFVPNRTDYNPYILHNGKVPAGRGRDPLGGRDLGAPPGLDHGRLYRSADGRAAHLVYHPYSLTEEEAARLADWTDAAGAVSVILPAERSWYYPGQTLLVIVTAGGVRWEPYAKERGICKTEETEER